MKTLSDDGQSNFEICIAMLVLSALAVCLRFAIRVTGKMSLTGSDYFCLLGLLLFVGYVAVMLQYMVNGPGHGEFNLPILIYTKAYAQIIYLLKILFATELLFTLVITTIKISILLFYYNLFHISTRFRWAVRISGVICLVWCILFTFLIIFQCRPVNALWDQMAAPQFCMSTPKLLLGYEITNLFLDVLVLCLPLGMLRTLQLPGFRKASVAGMFLLGGFVCIASIMRLTYIWIPGHTEAANLPMVMIWSTIQLGVAILCSSLPTYAPLFRKAKPAIKTLTNTLYASQKTNSRGTHGISTNGSTAVSGSSGHYKNLDKYGGSTISSQVEPDFKSYPLKPISTNKGSISRPIVINNGVEDQVPLSPSPDPRASLQGRVQHFAGGGNLPW